MLCEVVRCLHASRVHEIDQDFGLQLIHRSVRLNFYYLWSISTCKWSERKKVDIISEKSWGKGIEKEWGHHSEVRKHLFAHHST